jgi:hypothetical protein
MSAAPLAFPRHLARKRSAPCQTSSITIVSAFTNVEIEDGFDLTGEYLRDSQTEPAAPIQLYPDGGEK